MSRFSLNFEKKLGLNKGDWHDTREKSNYSC
jgi:hypothetical protein